MIKKQIEQCEREMVSIVIDVEYGKSNDAVLVAIHEELSEKKEALKILL